MESLREDANAGPRRAQARDAALLAELARVALPLGGSEEEFRADVERQPLGSAALWIFPPDAGPRSCAAGGALVRIAADEAELLWLAVHPEDRRRGLGRALLAAATAWVDAREASLYLEVRASNEAAIALYHSAGFVVAGRRARYYRDGEDALLLRRPAPGCD